MIQRARGLPHLLPRPVKSRLRTLRRRLGRSPMQRVLAELERRRVPLADAHVLEVFGGVGDHHIRDYAPRVRTLEVWDQDPSVEAGLRQNIPSAKIRIGDSFQLIKETQARYDIVVVDSPVLFSAAPLEIFLHSLCKVTDHPVFILTVLPDLDPATRQAWPPLRHVNDAEPAHKRHQSRFETDILEHVQLDALLGRRRTMFQTDTPEHIPLERMTQVYAQLARRYDLDLDWSFSLRRHFAHYLVFRLRPAG